jgi:hypothetical protein
MAGWRPETLGHGVEVFRTSEDSLVVSFWNLGLRGFGHICHNFGEGPHMPFRLNLAVGVCGTSGQPLTS